MPTVPLPSPDTDSQASPVTQAVERLVEAAAAAFGEDLRSITLFGSVAEGRWRPTSDVNLVFVLRRFERQRVDSLRPALRLANAAVGASVMFLLESELPAAVEAFPVKFTDIARRRRVLIGEDVFAAVAPSREALRAGARQMLLNLTLRLRDRYALTSLREERLALVIAGAAAPLRVAAATLMDLEGHRAASPREALDTVVRAIGNPAWGEALERMTLARTTRSLPAGSAAPTLFELIRIADHLRLQLQTPTAP